MIAAGLVIFNGPTLWPVTWFILVAGYVYAALLLVGPRRASTLPAIAAVAVLACVLAWFSDGPNIQGAAFGHGLAVAVYLLVFAIHRWQRARLLAKLHKNRDPR